MDDKFGDSDIDDGASDSEIHRLGENFPKDIQLQHAVCTWKAMVDFSNRQPQHWKKEYATEINYRIYNSSALCALGKLWLTWLTGSHSIESEVYNSKQLWTYNSSMLCTVVYFNNRQPLYWKRSMQFKWIVGHITPVHCVHLEGYGWLH